MPSFRPGLETADFVSKLETWHPQLEKTSKGVPKDIFRPGLDGIKGGKPEYQYLFLVTRSNHYQNKICLSPGKNITF
jgi:hypothetical protein